MTHRTLVIGGTGPTGPHLVRGLVERGHDVTILHTGRHEIDDLPDVPHLHGDPFDQQSVAEIVAGRSFDTVVATYGRVRILAEEFAGRCDHFVVVGGTPVYNGYLNPSAQIPTGVWMPVHEDDHPKVAPDETGSAAGYRGAPIRRTEDAVFGLHDKGAFAATYLRYPAVYGPRNPHPWEWTVVRRVLDDRPWMILSDEGRGVFSRASARNAAHALLLAVDRPEVSGGRAYNVADDTVLSIRQWAELVSEAAGRVLPIRSLPGGIPSPGWAVIAFNYQATASCVLDTTRLREDLGYRDVQTVRDGIRETVEWMLANREQIDADPNVLDPFDYDAEDRLMAAYDRMVADLAPLVEPFASGLRDMTTPQTAKGAGSER